MKTTSADVTYYLEESLQWRKRPAKSDLSYIQHFRNDETGSQQTSTYSTHENLRVKSVQ